MIEVQVEVLVQNSSIEMSGLPAIRLSIFAGDASWTLPPVLGGRRYSQH